MNDKLWLVIGVLLGLGCLLRCAIKSKWIKWLIKAAMGVLMIVAGNALIPQYAIGLNGYTVGFTTVLGVPGVMTLYVVKAML